MTPPANTRPNEPSVACAATKIVQSSNTSDEPLVSAKLAISTTFPYADVSASNDGSSGAPPVPNVDMFRLVTTIDVPGGNDPASTRALLRPVKNLIRTETEGDVVLIGAT